MKKWIFLAFLLVFSYISIERLIKYLGDIPDPARLSDYTPSLTTKIYDIKGEIIAELFTEKRTMTPFSQIPKNMVNAIVAIEDTRFFKHWGIDPYRIAGAAIANLKSGNRSEGGSTITQQLSKWIFLSPRKTFARKIKEAILSIQLERDYSKEEILTMYLNETYFGSGAYGISTAAKIYFSKDVKDLNLEECALLAGILRAPSNYSPFINPEKAKHRRSIVLSRMQDVGFITETERKKADEAPISTQASRITAKFAPHFIDYIRQTLEKKYGSRLYQGGLEIYTTLDKKMQIAAESVFEKHLSEFDTIVKSSIPVEGALICIETKTGGIKALVGGRNFRTSQFNRVLQAKRQPGSAFKIFVYTAAIENGFTPATIIEDTPVTYYNNGTDWELLSGTTDFSDVQDKDFLDEILRKDAESLTAAEKILWQPKNYMNTFNGPVLLRKAFEQSLNISAIKVTEAITPATVAYYAKLMGIESNLTETISLALGSSEVTLKEITSAVGCLANSGIKTNPYAVIKVLDNKGRVLEENFPSEIDVLKPQTAYIMTNLLKGVVQNGTGRNARRLKRPAAGKTGTTNDSADAWFIGYTPQLVCGVWVGYDDRKSLGPKMTGGRVACPVWTDFMLEALKGQPKIDFIPPENIIFAKIDSQTGLLALGRSRNVYLEAFIKGTEPRKFSTGKISRFSESTADTEVTISSDSLNEQEQEPAKKYSDGGGF
ncbi:MAG: Penicillin-binding protein 1A [Elusimicrobia bacterium ADurb.Bin231]|nr:MAG: Penicillin-binding protein 1A [Elusimicrobia bacterium ADurb.Bin231]